MNAQPTGKIQPPKKGRKKAILMVALLLVALIAGVIWAMWPREPSYKGKPLSYWVKTLHLSPTQSNTDDPEQIECREALRHIGTNALPYLMRMLQAKDSVIEEKFMDLVDRHGPDSWEVTRADEQNTGAASVFWFLGEAASNAIPTLIRIYTNAPSEDSGRAANSALRALYPASGATVPLFIPLEDRAKWYYNAGMKHMSLGASSNALLAFSDAIKLNPTNSLIYLRRATAKVQFDDFAGALPDLTNALALNSSNLPAYQVRAFCKFNMQDWKGTEADCTAALQLYTNDFNFYSYRGLARVNLRKPDEALADFTAAIGVDNTKASGYRNRANVQAIRKEYELGMEDVSKALELDGKSSFAYQVRGYLHHSLKEHEAASQDFEKAIELNPKDPGGYTGRARARAFLDDLTRASADLEKALQLDPKNLQAHTIRGFLNAKRGADVDALADFRRAVELSPDIPDIYGLLGVFQYRCHQWEPALKNCRKALEMDARDGKTSVRACIWLIRAQTGEEAEASRELNSFLQSLPSTKTNAWEVSVARYLSGSLTESNFLSQAATVARRPSEITGQKCEAFYYAGMKHKIAGDKQGAREFFQKSVETKDNNNIASWNAATEVRGLTNK